jgi:hypothetical protein
MNKRIKILTILLFANIVALAGIRTSDTAYLVYYATIDGKTGHIGIAIDNYRILYREVRSSKGQIEVSDTIPSGHLTYFDLWPAEDHFNAARTAVDVPAVYYKLPVSSTEEITLNSLYDNGIPHKEYYPCDGILKIKTGWQQDQKLIRILDSISNLKRLFNAQKFNCADFVELALEKLLSVDLKSKEFVLSGWSTTPNKLYRNMLRLQNVEIVKDPGDKSNGSFLKERILYNLVNGSKPD